MGSLKNSQRNGAERFIAKTLLCSQACWPTVRMDSGDTVRKNPCGKEGVVVRLSQVGGASFVTIVLTYYKQVTKN